MILPFGGLSETFREAFGRLSGTQTKDNLLNIIIIRNNLSAFEEKDINMDVFNAPDHNHKTIHAPIAQFLCYLASLNYSPKSIRSYKYAFARFVSFLTARHIARLADVTAKDLSAYRRELVEQRYADQSVSLYLRSVRKLFAHLEETRRIFVNPARSMIIPKVSEKIRPVPTEDDMQRLLAQPDPSTTKGIRDRAVMETFYSTGARLFELTGMDLGDMDLKQGRVSITGKGDKERVAPMGRRALLWTDRYLAQVRPKFLQNKAPAAALWLGVAGRRIHPLTVERSIRAYGKQAGIGLAVTPHALRRACATHMLRGGAHPVQIRMLLGHGSLKSLSRYLKVTITDMKNTHAQGNPGK